MVVCFEISGNYVPPKHSFHSVGFGSTNQIRLIYDQFGLHYNYVERIQFYNVNGTEYFVSNINSVPTNT